MDTNINATVEAVLEQLNKRAEQKAKAEQADSEKVGSGFLAGSLLTLLGIGAVAASVASKKASRKAAADEQAKADEALVNRDNQLAQALNALSLQLADVKAVAREAAMERNELLGRIKELEFNTPEARLNREADEYAAQARAEFLKKNANGIGYAASPAGQRELEELRRS